VAAVAATTQPTRWFRRHFPNHVVKTDPDRAARVARTAVNLVGIEIQPRWSASCQKRTLAVTIKAVRLRPDDA
jgi:hypothetical protein